MGIITAYGDNDFISAQNVFSRIKREFESFDSVNILNDREFPNYVGDVLADLGVGGLQEDNAFLKIKDGKAKLPDNYKILHAAWKCKGCTAKVKKRHLQDTSYFENDVTCEVRRRDANCQIECKCSDKIIESITIKQYVNEFDEDSYDYSDVSLLTISPNARKHLSPNSPNVKASSPNEITITKGYIFTNFEDGDIYIEYYGMPIDENNVPLIPNKPEVEKAIEWYIKWQLLLSYWMVDALPNAQNKWSKAEQEYEKAMGKCRYLDKLPSFATAVNSIRTRRGINKISFFSNSLR